MKLFRFAAILMAGAALSACSSAQSGGTGGPAVVPTRTNIGGQTSHVGTTYAATQVGGAPGTLSGITVAKSTINGQPMWLNTGAQTSIAGYESANVLAIGGFNNNALIKGVSGVLTTTPLTGTATYTGRYSQTTPTSVNSGALSIDVNFAANTFADTTAGVSVSGTISGTQFTGTYTRGGLSAPLAGGFFGTNEMVGAFGNSTVAGVIYGTTP